MTPIYQSLITHLWESTVFGIACAFLILLLGRSWSFSRHLLAWASLAKFIIPFAAFSTFLEKTGSLFPKETDQPGVLFPYVANFSESLKFETWINAETSYTATSQTSILWATVITVIWALGVLTLFSFWSFQYVRVKASIRTRCKEAEHSWKQMAMRIWEKPEAVLPKVLACDNKCLVAGVFGFRRPVVIIPATLPQAFTDFEREAFLRHEFQHIYKRDNLWIYLQKFIRNLVWFHPLAWWFDHQISAEREILRDAEVIRKTNNIPSYLNCLMKASNFDVPTNYANSVGIKGSAFSRRIKAISRFRPTQLIDRLSAVGSIAAIIVLTAFLSSNFSITNLEAADAGGNPNQAPENMITSEELRNEARKLESTIETFYNEHRDRFYQEEQVHLRIIRLAPSAKEDHDLLTQRANKMMDLLKHGEAFEELAKRYSQDVKGELGGDWGWVKRSDIRSELSDILFSLEKGAYSEPTQVKNDLFIVKVEDRKESGVQSLAEVRDQILEMIVEQSEETPNSSTGEKD